jgi:hypothetical protein
MHITKVQQQDRHSHRLGWAVILSLIALLSACAAPPKPKPFTLKGEGAQTLNRDANGKSLSVVVHIYQLKDAREFSKLTFDMLASGRSADSELLGRFAAGKNRCRRGPWRRASSALKSYVTKRCIWVSSATSAIRTHITGDNCWMSQTLKKRGLGPEGAPGATLPGRGLLHQDHRRRTGSLAGTTARRKRRVPAPPGR